MSVTRMHRRPQREGAGALAAHAHVQRRAVAFPAARADHPKCPCAGGCPRCTTSAQPGQPLPAGMRRSLEASYHTDLSAVRMHTGPRAHELARNAGAHAMTGGNDIYFARDRYLPQTAEGWRRIAHEVAHVVQQRHGLARGAGSYARAEAEAERGSAHARAGQPATISQQSGGLLQRDDDASAPTASSEYQLQLDPEIQRLMFQQYLRFWLGTALTEGEPAEPAEEESEATPSPDAPAAAPLALPPLYQLPLEPEFFRPIDPAMIAPDIGAIMAPYNLRGVPLAARDVDAATAIFQRNYGFVSALPDLRSMAPGFIRPLIPGHWRRSMAEAFTAATLNTQLRSDYPTPLEAADLSFYRMTGISTTYIPIPGISF